MQDLGGKEISGQRGTYLIDRLLAETGHSQVYQAVWHERQQYVCVKVLSRYLGQDVIRRLRHEESIVSRLQHPNIIRLLDTAYIGEQHCTIMEKATDGSLQDNLQGERLPMNMILSVVEQIAGALDFVHRQGIVHRDVKPSNILVDKGRFILTDFGIARAMAEKKITGEEVFGGTPVYVAPEGLVDKDIGPAIDQYSLAVVTFEMLTGKLPFDGDTIYAIVRAIVQDEPPSLRSIYGAIPPNVEQVVLRALSKQPEQRYADVTEFAQELSRAANYPRQVQPHEPQPSVPPPPLSKAALPVFPGPSTRERTLLMVLVCLAACLGSFLGTLIAFLLVSAL
jgi:serine/threonine protein kinase